MGKRREFICECMRAKLFRRVVGCSMKTSVLLICTNAEAVLSSIFLGIKYIACKQHWGDIIKILPCADIQARCTNDNEHKVYQNITVLDRNPFRSYISILRVA